MPMPIIAPPLFDTRDAAADAADADVAEFAGCAIITAATSISIARHLPRRAVLPADLFSFASRHYFIVSLPPLI